MICNNCGYHFKNSLTCPLCGQSYKKKKVCPVCQHPESFMELKAENYSFGENLNARLYFEVSKSNNLIGFMPLKSVDIKSFTFLLNVASVCLSSSLLSAASDTR